MFKVHWRLIVDVTCVILNCLSETELLRPSCHFPRPSCHSESPLRNRVLETKLSFFGFKLSLWVLISTLSFTSTKLSLRSRPSTRSLRSHFTPSFISPRIVSNSKESKCSRSRNLLNRVAFVSAGRNGARSEPGQVQFGARVGSGITHANLSLGTWEEKNAYRHSNLFPYIQCRIIFFLSKQVLS